MKRAASRAWVAAGASALGVASCQDPTLFTSGRGANVCQDTIPAACGNTAHCVLTPSQFLQGKFPGSNVFIVRTDGAQTVTFDFLLADRESSGSRLDITSTEPNCSQQSSYASETLNPDIFMLAGPDGVLSIPIRMATAGDHLVQFNSDAYCSYTLRYE
jgi:hypothetical protein